MGVEQWDPTDVVSHQHEQLRYPEHEARTISVR